MNAIPIYGLDIAKRVFQLYWVEVETGEIINRRFGRDELIEFLAQRPAGRIALEACGSSHWWARKLTSLGHEVVLLHAKFIRPFVQNNKTDASDARAIWTAVQQPGIRTVAAKTEEQQAMLGLHRMRQLLVKFRTMQVNQVRGLLYEFGATFKTGRQAGLAEIRERMAELEQITPGMLLTPIQDQLKRIDGINDEIEALEQRIGQWQKQEVACQVLTQIPGIGRLTATALVATMGNPKTFMSGREFASFLGLVPRQKGTGGKVWLLGISKRGDCYLRTLLIHGARAVLFKAREKGPWIEALRQRRPTNVTAVALANKMARTAWALLAHDRVYKRGYVSIKPA
ncbi:Transposase IS116/IS110/IS902 family protein [Mycoavidus cysteinexigens]|uniref:Transposase IS116/IS110/IS902 family protein n=1 Tax=Mycoavidus cysteinexigens TaxID=1553431 RepID=A0A2Z6ESV6_9BURK|nr:IS110 family transposase [Mycoavidus cysteinexigens]BBE08494.1 Transposase IS116/IS110/IS902 family protein [Mycoavidus cysteinexigens]GAM52801.1 transposase [bacterium endosymbiont of Mortierella elongata FMR23-6]GLR02245.1 putative family 20 transposase [Mycoavidus cysteinexigens]